MLKYLVKVLNTLLVFYLCNDLNGTFVLVEFSLNFHDVGFASYKRVGFEVNIFFGGKFNEFFIAVGYGGQVDPYSRNIYALFAAKFSVVLDLTNKG